MSRSTRRRRTGGSDVGAATSREALRLAVGAAGAAGWHLGPDVADATHGSSADEAGLPEDPEFRAAFVAYLEWGSRIAKENTTPGAQPPAAMPVPRWSWVSNANPDARVSALSAPEVTPEQPPTGPTGGRRE